MVDDEARLGALRFVESEGGPLDSNRHRRYRHSAFHRAASLAGGQRTRADAEKETGRDLRLLLGARFPRSVARVQSHCARSRWHALASRSFRRRRTKCKRYDGEAVALDLAGKAGIQVPAWRVETVAGKPMLVLRRFGPGWQ
jgi:serine/threonine-protein kinase HipA